MTKHSGKHYASVTHAVSLWLCGAAVNNAHKYCNQVNVYLTLMLFVVVHRESCIKGVKDVCKVASHKQAKHRAVSGCVLPWVCSLARVSPLFHTHFSPGPCLILHAGGFPTRNLCRGLLPSWRWQGRHSKQSICIKHPPPWL